MQQVAHRFGAAAGVTPYTTNEQGQGPAWSNSLLEDNAEFGYGMLLASKRRERLASKMTKAFSVASDSLRLLMEDWIAHLSESEGTQQRAAKLRAALLEEKRINLYWKQFMTIKIFLLNQVSG